MQSDLSYLIVGKKKYIYVTYQDVSALQKNEELSNALHYSQKRDEDLTKALKALGMVFTNIFLVHVEDQKVEWLKIQADKENILKQCQNVCEIRKLIHDNYMLPECQKGYCVAPNQQKAFELYKEAANENDPIAQYNIGICHLNGFVVKKDTIKGLRFLEKSAMQGTPHAQVMLGYLYYYGGNTIKRDVKKGIEWLTLASDQGMPNAQYDLSMIYYNGESGEITPDYNKAKELCRKAAEQGLPAAKWAMENKFNSKDK